MQISCTNIILQTVLNSELVTKVQTQDVSLPLIVIPSLDSPDMSSRSGKYCTQINTARKLVVYIVGITMLITMVQCSTL